MHATTGRTLIGLGLAAALALSGCGGSPTAPTKAPASTTPAASFPVTVHTDNGDVMIPRRPTAIVSLAVTATEMLYAIGAGSQVKAVDENSDYPPEAPRTGLSAFEPNIEAIAGYGPDLVVVDSVRGDVARRLGALSIPVLVLPPATELADVYEQVVVLGQATGQEAQARAEADRVRGELEAIAASVPRTEEVSYYYELTPDYYSASSVTFVGKLFQLIGMTSIADAAPGGADTNGGYPQLSAEFIVRSDPDFIFLADAVCCQQNATSVAQRPGWSNLSAVRNSQVVALDDDIASRWGPRIVQLLQTAADALKASRG